MTIFEAISCAFDKTKDEKEKRKRERERVIEAPKDHGKKDKGIVSAAGHGF